MLGDGGDRSQLLCARRLTPRLNLRTIAVVFHNDRENVQKNRMKGQLKTTSLRVSPCSV
uniref:Uncharacterized protein n=1 Tax=Anguilla anguilla TaxID=7936 RepID=A0A0E9W3N2_ANGAN